MNASSGRFVGTTFPARMQKVSEEMEALNLIVHRSAFAEDLIGHRLLCLYVGFNDSACAIVFELAAFGDLWHLLEDWCSPRTMESARAMFPLEAVRVMIQICDGVAYLHSIDIAGARHRRHGPQHQELCAALHDGTQLCNVDSVRIFGERLENVLDALEMLGNMEHRGGCGCEPNTGDGAGILVGLPEGFLRTVAKEDLGVDLPEKGRFGAGLVFLPKDEAERQKCIAAVDAIIAEQGQQCLGWREVPTEAEAKREEVVGGG